MSNVSTIIDAMKIRFTTLVLLCFTLAVGAEVSRSTNDFEGKFFRARGDTEFLKLLDISRRMFGPDPEFQNLSMLYMRSWNGLVEGPTWDAWWIQNSYGTTYASLPFLQEPFVTFLQNSQDLWFDQMGDGKRVGAEAPFNWVAPDGCLCDAARPGWIVYKQGDGPVHLHDWAMEFTAAGILLQSELLLISRDQEKIKHYLPKLERSANFIETRRGTNNLFLAGAAGNLLAPSYAGWKKPDGTYDKAYLTGLSITYIAALERLIELEKLAGRTEQISLWSERRASAKGALPQLATDQGYFIRSLDPDGVKHGVFGAKQHGYFEASPNHDAIAFRVVDDQQAAKIYHTIASIPGLRPHDFVIANYPAYDDMYTGEHDIWTFGTWINGGHWSTCEARMMLAYFRLGKFEDARRSMRQLMKFAEQFRLDNPLTDFGNAVYQPNQPINLCYDSFGPPAAFVRGLFEYLYSAEGLILIPHLPAQITSLEQKFPIRFGQKELFVSTSGSGPIDRVEINGRRWKQHDGKSISLPYQKVPTRAEIKILLGQKRTMEKKARQVTRPTGGTVLPDQFRKDAEALEKFLEQMKKAGLSDAYEAAHAQLALDAMRTISTRQQLANQGALKTLPTKSQEAADQSYIDTVQKLLGGFQDLMKKYGQAPSAREQKIGLLWKDSAK